MSITGKTIAAHSEPGDVVQIVVQAAGEAATDTENRARAMGATLYLVGEELSYASLVVADEPAV